MGSSTSEVSIEEFAYGSNFARGWCAGLRVPRPVCLMRRAIVC